VGRIIDMTDQICGSWLVLKRAENTKGGIACWLCRCLQCGNEYVVSGASLRSGGSSSCSSCANTIHGFSGLPWYRSYCTMIDRCYNPNWPGYEIYGGRGISVCDLWRFGDNEWNGMRHFHYDMGDRPDGCSLDRVDSNGNYCKMNCRWSTPEQQANNTRCNKFIVHNNIKMTYSQWERELGLSNRIIAVRKRRGSSNERALSVSDLRRSK
jgi:hypothetical protein